MEIQNSEIEQVFESVCVRLHSASRTAVQTPRRQTQDSAIREAHRRLIQNPSDNDAIHVLAASSLVRHRPEKSLEILESVPGLLHHDAIGNRLAGYAWLAQNHVSQARRCFDQAVRLDPNQPDCWLWLGRMAEESGQDEGAIHYYERAILFDDVDDTPALALSQLHARHRDLKNAIHTLRVCLLRNRRSAALNAALAKLLKQRARILGRNLNRAGQQRLLDEALDCYRVANASAPTCRTLVDQGLLEQRLGHFDAAIDSFEKAVKSNGESTIALNHLANAYVDRGDIQEALDVFEKALQIDPSHAFSHFRFSRAKKFKAGRETDRYIALLQKQIETPDQPNQKQIYLHFALAKVLDDTAQYDRAWQHYDRANKLKPTHSASEASLRPSVRLGVEPRRSPVDKPIEETCQTFTREYFNARHGQGNPDQTPVFIVGMPRSGTTLTEQILSSHPQVAGAGELPCIDQIRQEIIFREKQRVRHAGMPTTPRSYLSLVEGVTGADLQEHTQTYMKRLNEYRTDELRVTDKMPTNFLHLGLIATLFPQATIIHCRRHPMDVLVSCYCQNLNAPFCDLDQLVGYHRNYRRMMRHWEQVLPMSIHTVDYESLVVDPETESRRLIQHCGLEWNDACLAFHASDRAVHTPSKWQVRQPMYKSSMQKWRRFESQLASIADQIETEMQQEQASMAVTTA
tara:strand:- start:176780 stop:178840 length:2061 start_codon:yes stop_codon:yes gene_type:complete